MPDCVVLHLKGRLDATGCKDLDARLKEILSGDVLSVILDMAGVDYLSSAGLRIFIAAAKNLAGRGGQLIPAAVQAYPAEVMAMAGVDRVLTLEPDVAAATALARSLAKDREHSANWDRLERRETLVGAFTFMHHSDDAGAAEVLGDVRDVLHARITRDMLHSKRFSHKEFSIGLGGLGDRVDDYFTIMGEMITIGGTMVWLPTDGSDTPDFLVPQVDTGTVFIRTGFNVALAGAFNELVHFTSARPEGATLTDLYRALFQLAKDRRPDHRGALALAGRAEMPAVFGSGVKKAPVADLAPQDGGMIMDPKHIAEWLDADKTPRLSNVTVLLCGIGVDLTASLDAFHQKYLESVFYLNPANTSGKDQMLHNHGVCFARLPMEEKRVNLHQEIRQVVEEGEFLDMRHLLDTCTVSRAFLGVSYVQEFRPDTAAVATIAGEI